ncbi:MAG: prolipoprotein diacylglyceryl transferase [Clostridia bacterium]|nr:prolipoprotein diacylglyceryl transferase [Clostridia bacterium]
MKITRTALIVFGFSIHWYGVLIAMGVLLAILLMSRREKRYGLAPDTSLSLALWIVPFAIVCARAYYVAFEWRAFRDNPLEIFDIRGGGMAIYGGVLGGVLAGWIFTRAKHIPFLTMADVAAPALALGQAIGRWGNFINQEAYGVPITSPALQWFPLAVYIEREGSWFAATFFYESAWCLLICVLILLLERTRSFARPGRAALFYVFMYAAERTVVEGLRMDSLFLGSIRVSQALSALLLLAAALLLCLRLPRRWRLLLLIPLAAIPLFFLSPLAFSAILLTLCLACYALTSKG